MENLFEKGCLVQLNVSQWGATRKIDTNRLVEMSDHPDWLSASKKLVDPEALKPICKLANSARNYLKTVSLPFPVQGMLFIPKDMISKVDGKLDEFRAGFDTEVDFFNASYETLRETAKYYLGDLFNDLDYPADIKSRFGFAWRFIVMDVPNGNTGILSPEVYEREKQKFIRTMEEARTMAVEALREEFAQMVEHITERLTAGPDGKPKVFKNATVEGFYEYFENFKARNIFKDDDLAQLVDRAQSLLNGTSAENIRNDESLKDTVRRGMEDIEQLVSESLNRPRRKIVLN